MQLITSAQRQKLLEKGRAQRVAVDRQDQVIDFELVVKLCILSRIRIDTLHTHRYLLAVPQRVALQ